jgi:hypothetical protein
LQLTTNAGDNRALESIYLGSNVTRIESGAFANYGKKDSLIAYSTRAEEDFEYIANDTGLQSIEIWNGSST